MFDIDCTHASHLEMPSDNVGDLAAKSPGRLF